jgi:hypothetical protein
MREDSHLHTKKHMFYQAQVRTYTENIEILFKMFCNRYVRTSKYLRYRSVLLLITPEPGRGIIHLQSSHYNEFYSYGYFLVEVSATINSFVRRFHVARFKTQSRLFYSKTLVDPQSLRRRVAPPLDEGGEDV